LAFGLDVYLQTFDNEVLSLVGFWQFYLSRQLQRKSLNLTERKHMNLAENPLLRVSFSLTDQLEGQGYSLFAHISSNPVQFVFFALDHGIEQVGAIGDSLPQIVHVQQERETTGLSEVFLAQVRVMFQLLETELHMLVKGLLFGSQRLCMQLYLGLVCGLRLCLIVKLALFVLLEDVVCGALIWLERNRLFMRFFRVLGLGIQQGLFDCIPFLSSIRIIQNW
jgi:hypothetical protein